MEPGPPSPFLAAQLGSLLRVARLGPVADLACGRGRQAVAAAEAGARVVGFDRSEDALRELAARAARRELCVHGVRADLEAGTGIPAATGAFTAVLVFRFLYRPLAPEILRVLRPGGLLLYETFGRDQRARGWGPRSERFLAAPGELRRLFPDLEVLAEWEGTRLAGDRVEDVVQLAGLRR